MRPTYKAPARQVAPTKLKIWLLPYDGINVDVSRLMAVPSNKTRR